MNKWTIQGFYKKTGSLRLVYPIYPHHQVGAKSKTTMMEIDSSVYGNKMHKTSQFSNSGTVNHIWDSR